MKTIFQKWLFVFVLAAFIITFLSSWWIHSNLAENSAVELLQNNLDDAARRVISTRKNLQTIITMSNASALAKTRALAMMIKENPAILNDNNKLDDIRKKLDVDEVHVSDANGILLASLAYAPATGGVKSYRGYDMKSSAQSAEFMPACTDPEFALVQRPQRNGVLKILFQYAGIARLDAPGIVQIGYRPERIEEASSLANIKNIEKDVRIGMNGNLFIEKNPGYREDYRKIIRTAQGISLTAVYDNYLLTANLPKEEMYMSRDSVIKILIIGNLILFGVIFLLISRLLQKVVINGIYTVNDSLKEITGGNLEKEINVTTTTEFQSLSSGINSTVAALKKAIENESRRIDAELEMGKTIQTSVLPVDFHDTPNYRLHAGMFTAREVGGDFYDFFTIDENRTALLIADVSGKGITAALYMMNAKSLLKELILLYPPAEAFAAANQELCRTNKAHMFLTAFLAVLDRRTGIIQCVNAGHNPPLLKHSDNSVEYLKIKHSLVLSASPKAKYTAVPVQLQPGDKLFLYTDGVTEAMNLQNELFGEKRFMETVVSAEGSLPEILDFIRSKTAEFAGEAPQNDDITMLIMEYISASQ